MLKSVSVQPNESPKVDREFWDYPELSAARFLEVALLAAALGKTSRVPTVVEIEVARRARGR